MYMEGRLDGGIKKGEERKREITDWIRKGTAKIKKHMKATMDT